MRLPHQFNDCQMEILIKLYSGVLHNRIRSWDTNFYPTEEIYSVPLPFLFKSVNIEFIIMPLFF